MPDGLLNHRNWIIGALVGLVLISALVAGAVQGGFAIELGGMKLTLGASAEQGLQLVFARI